MSIFNLKTDVSELSGDKGVTRSQFEQITASRDVSNNTFANGSISYRFEVSGQKWWIPSESYLRLRLKITKPDGTTQLVLSDNISPNMNLVSCLFQSQEFRINDKTVSRISDYVPQVDTLEARLSKSRSWMNGIGESTQLLQHDFSERQSLITSDGTLVKELTVPVKSAVLPRNSIGFDVAGGTGADRNAAAYVGGAITFTVNGGGLLPADVRLVYPLGSFFTYTAIQGADATDPRLNVPLVVVSHTSATEIVVENILPNDVPADGRTNFTRSIQSVDPKGYGDNEARSVSDIELIYRPSLSIFKLDHALPTGQYELVLNPATKSTYKNYAIETLLSNPSGSKVAGVDFELSIEDMYLYIKTVEGPRQDNITYLLDLEQTRCQTYNVANASFSQRTFDVSPSTYAITCAFQDLRAGTDNRASLTKFKSYSDVFATGSENEIDLRLTRFFYNYAGVSQPSPDSDGSFNATVDRTTQRYLESMMNSEAYYDTGSGESIYEYHKRGSYLYYKVDRDGSDRSTRLTVHTQFNATDAEIANTRILLFDHSKQVARVRIQDGRVVDVQVEDV
jgi:hypothetical protein